MNPIINPTTGVGESNEGNNTHTEQLIGGLASLFDLDIEITSFNIDDLGQISFEVMIQNRGIVPVNYPKLWFAVTDLTSSRLLGTSASWNGEAGHCRTDNQPGTAVVLAPLASDNALTTS
ncbi:MAG: hypothetical protein ACE5FZ_08130 [Nitrospiria bacterium]